MSRKRKVPAGRGQTASHELPAGEGSRPATAAPHAAERALWIMLALLLAARAALSWAPGMWAWSLNLQRFLAPVPGWALWTLAALALLPPVARRAAPWLARAGDAIEDHPVSAGAAWAASAAVLVWLLPDQVRFVGDFLLRLGTVEVIEQPGRLFPQALPLDVFLHYTVPAAVAASGFASANTAARILGACEAALLGLLATAFARTLSLRGIAAFASATVVLFGGYLGMFTGFSKAFAESCLLMAAAGLFALEMVRRDRGLLPLGIVVALGATLHRSALGMLPGFALAWVLWSRIHGGRAAWRQPRVLLALAVPLVTLAVMVPRIIAVVRTWDTVHFRPLEVQSQGGPLGAALAGNRPLDLLNLILLLSPLALLSPLLAMRLLRAGPAPRGDLRAPAGASTLLQEGLLLVALALPFLAVMPFIHPAQGLFRDWDDFAATGVSVSLLTAWLTGRALERAGRRAWLGVTLSLAVMAPTVQWLVLHADVDRGLARVRAFMVEPPARSDAERGKTWDFLGIRNIRLAGERLRRGTPDDERAAVGYWAAADEALGHAAETSPSPRILREWALARAMRGDFRGAREIYRLVVRNDPASEPGWTGLANTSVNLGDREEARRAAGKLLRLRPRDPAALRVLEWAARREPTQPPRP
jgi:hypothetical protein